MGDSDGTRLQLPAAAPLPARVPAGLHSCAAVSLQLEDVSVIAGIMLWDFYFRFYPGAIRAPQIVAFLKLLLRHIPGKLLLVWDRLPAHRSRMVQEFVAAQKGRIHTEHLPAYVPELNSTEYIWSYCKHHKLPKLPNACPKDFSELKHGPPSRTPEHAPPHPDHRLLETGFSMARMTLYYAEVSKISLPKYP